MSLHHLLSKASENFYHFDTVFGHTYAQLLSEQITKIGHDKILSSNRKMANLHLQNYLFLNYFEKTFSHTFILCPGEISKNDLYLIGDSDSEEMFILYNI